MSSRWHCDWLATFKTRQHAPRSAHTFLAALVRWGAIGELEWRSVGALGDPVAQGFPYKVAVSDAHGRSLRLELQLVSVALMARPFGFHHDVVAVRALEAWLFASEFGIQVPGCWEAGTLEGLFARR